MKVAILTSGGDAPGMNAAVRSVVRSCLYYNIEPYAVYDGFRGLTNDRFIKMSRKDVSEILSRGGTILGTSRYDEFKEDKTVLKTIENLKKQKIDAVIAIGGDGTFKGAERLHKKGFPVVAIPASIDNDINGTDFTIGFHTALNTIVDDIDKIKDTSSSHQRASIIETMGRHRGDLALYAGLSTGAEFIITPENPIDKKEIIETLKQHKKEGRRNAIIVVTENILNVNEFAEEITEKSGFACRATVLGYVQRGGSPVPSDRLLAGRMGAYAVDCIIDKKFGVAIGVRHEDLVAYPFSEAFIRKDSEMLKKMYNLVPKIS